MGYLGLDQTVVKDDNLFQRMFWPSDHAGETDTLGKQGFWLCMVIAVLAALALLARGDILTALLSTSFYLLAGIGVREHSQPAAVLVALACMLNVIAGVALTHGPPGALPMIALLLLAANVRGTYIADKWARQGDPEAMPARRNDNFGDKLVDQMPQAVWPKARIAFFVVAAVYLLLTIAGTVYVIVLGPARLPSASAVKTIEVGPPPAR